MIDQVYNTIRYQLTPSVATVTLHRPRAGNRVNAAMALELGEVCRRIRDDGALTVILTGRGQVFSSGREKLPASRRADTAVTPAEWLQLHRASAALAALEIPLIAAINGDALDHGLELALACDLRVAARGTRLGFTDISRGIVPWDGGTQRLPRLVGRTHALEMLLTSRVIEAQQALGWGLVNEVVEPGDLRTRTQELALEIASGAPIAARYAKETVLKGMDMTLEQGLGLEADLNVILQSTCDRTEGLRSFFEKRDTHFRGE